MLRAFSGCRAPRVTTHRHLLGLRLLLLLLIQLGVIVISCCKWQEAWYSINLTRVAQSMQAFPQCSALPQILQFYLIIRARSVVGVDWRYTPLTLDALLYRLIQLSDHTGVHRSTAGWWSVLDSRHTYFTTVGPSAPFLRRLIN